jgi:anti-sigma factor RsiW
MKCDEIYLYICDSLDEDLTSPHCREVKKHLAKCPGCKAYLTSLKTTIALYRSAPEPHVPSAAHKELFTTLSALMVEADAACKRPRGSRKR